jgi:hypothetical protein
MLSLLSLLKMRLNEHCMHVGSFITSKFNDESEKNISGKRKFFHTLPLEFMRKWLIRASGGKKIFCINFKFFSSSIRQKFSSRMHDKIRKWSIWACEPICEYEETWKKICVCDSWFSYPLEVFPIDFWEHTCDGSEIFIFGARWCIEIST